MLMAGAALPAAANGDEVIVAVASNFLLTARLLEGEFERDSGHEVVIVSGSTGQLYAQIVNGAPYEVLLAADAERPRLLGQSGAGVVGSVFTYAVGRLALWSRDEHRIDATSLATLDQARFRWFAIAEPDVAPYGTAAQQVLERLGVFTLIEPRLVRAQNIAQTFAMIETSNAELGLVALSQVLAYQGSGSHQPVPAELHEPIRQDAILLRAGNGRPAATAFMMFLAGPAAAVLIERAGYALASGGD
jgi:molybdate transport system substrate-binding protein